MTQTLTEQTQAKLLATLAELGGAGLPNDDLLFEGSRFVIPESMDIPSAIRFLMQKRDEEDMPMAFQRTFRYRPLDGARAANIAFRRTFGTAMQVSSWFDTAQMVTVDTGHGTSEQVPWGQIVVPVMPDAVVHFTSTHDAEVGDLFHVTIEGPRKYRFYAEGLFALIESELAVNSIYRGKAIAGDATFLDLSGVDPSTVTYSADVMTQLDANVWGMIRHTDAMLAHGVSLKRAVLLEGPYGTGKTLAAYLTAKVATENGWSFHYCRPGRDDLAMVMKTAELYQPAVVFFEDIDTLSDADGQTANSVSRLLDTFDGIANKGTKILAVMTTNHVDRIHKGMVRPGRLDAVIHIGALDRAGVETLVRSIVPVHLLSRFVDFDAVFEACEGYLPAFVKEAVERSLRYAIARSDGLPDIIETADLMNAAHGLRAQFDLMTDAKEHGTGGDTLSAALASVVESVVVPNVASVMESVGGAADYVVENGNSNANVVSRRMRKVIDNTVIYDDDDDQTGRLVVE